MSKQPLKNVKKKTEIYLPTSEEAFDELVEAIVKIWKLPSVEHAAAVIAIRISHMPPDQATTTMEYLAHCVIKNIAYQVAQAKGAKGKHKMEIDQLDALLQSNPYDQHALDALEKAVKDGSTYAKGVLDKYTPSEPTAVS